MIPKWAQDKLDSPANPMFKPEDVAAFRAIFQQNHVKSDPIEQKRQTITLKGKKHGKRSV